MKRVRQQVQGLLLGLGVVFLTGGSCHGYAPHDEIELARSFEALEALARDASPESRQQLTAVALSDKERFQVRRMACRLLSRVGARVDLPTGTPISQSDAFWPCWRLVEIRVSARESGESKGTAVQMLLNLLTDLSAPPSEETEAAKVQRGIQRSIAVQEIGFQIADQGLPPDRFPPEIVDNSAEVALMRLRSQYGQTEDPAQLVGQLRDVLGSENRWLREAAATLVAERGEAVLPSVIGLLQESMPAASPPPFTPQTETVQACLDILAGIGGDSAAATLRAAQDYPVPYVVRNAQARLRWVESGTKFRPLDRDLFAHPYVDE